ncbi:preprotein translocase subunit SecE [Patescibacteria group bacterium]|nr:preprotein translocase subunit SecE [Patescibacteria group bacterium]MBU1246567.1 preprotein translocase subunit SecE [Patescibacteria group bacterium]MBU1519466.1 preprotein translocase subunit SecE [Patescibacteria group bacterium]MBU1730556.1 preprotein translocase subunit SecE [Patescibacteria group bacterium]MBU1956325.1 preprotein translocase subunit SecE [Patescibacteria group bacterium]
MSLTNYIKETIGELKHVNWPTRKQVIYFTILVIIISIVVAVLLGVFDAAFNYLLKYLLKYINS